jgi:hypothetical protein
MVILRKLSKFEVDFIRNLQNTHIRKGIISDPSKKDIRIIRNLCSNLCKGRFNLNEAQRKKLIPYAPLIRTLADPSKKSVKTQISQSGSALAILAPILSSLIKIVAEKILKKVIPV